jgi:hypothetical protein
MRPRNRPRNYALLAVSATLLTASFATAAEKPGKPLDIRPAAASAPQPNTWRERAMKARGEVSSESAPMPVRGNAHAIDERGDRRDGEESGGGRLGKDRGEGGGPEE